MYASIFFCVANSCNSTNFVLQQKYYYFLFTDQTDISRKEFTPPDLTVNCLSDGVQVQIHITESDFNGVLYVKGHSKDQQCRRVVTLSPKENNKLEIFKVQFGNCGLIHVNVSSTTISLTPLDIKNHIVPYSWNPTWLWNTSNLILW